MPLHQTAQATAVFLPIALLLAGMFLYRAPPTLSDAASEYIDGEFEARRAEHGVAECRREAHESPVRSQGVEGSGLSLSSVFDPETAVGRCVRAAIGRAELQEEMRGGDRGWIAGAVETLPFESPWTLITYPPSYPPGQATPRIQAVRSACGGLPSVLRQWAAGPGECSPVHPSSPLWPVDDDYLSNLSRVMALASAITVMARVAADTNTALHQLLDGIVVVRDLSRGLTSADVAMLSVSAEMSLMAAFQSELFDATGGIDYVALHARIDLLVREPGDALQSARGFLLGEAFRYLEWRDEHGVYTPRELRASAAVYYERVEQVCASDLEECYEKLGEEGAGIPEGRLRDLVGARYHWFEDMTDSSTMSMRRYLTRSLQPDSMIRLAKVLLELVQEREEGACSGTVGESGSTPFSDGRIELQPLGGGQWGLLSPPLRFSSERTMMYFMCPAAVPDVDWEVETATPAREDSVDELAP